VIDYVGSPMARMRTTRKPGLMVVDDDPGIRNMLDEWMRQQGFSVWLAKSGQAALGVYRRNQAAIDVVLMDVCMPGLDGPKTFAALKTIVPQIQCCFMSGDLGHYTEAQLMHAGAASFIRKPFQLDELTRSLSSFARPHAFRPTNA